MVASPANEGALVFARIKELYENPIRGSFDLAHLTATHAYIFQDLPHHRPGVVRSDTEGWSKLRKLEDQPAFYAVSYESSSVAEKAAAVLARAGGPDALRNLSKTAFSEKMANIYGDLDRAHSFYEGNSRTLREFTRTLARRCWR